jgi:hypothetical protein
MLEFYGYLKYDVLYRNDVPFANLVSQSGQRVYVEEQNIRVLNEEDHWATIEVTERYP